MKSNYTRTGVRRAGDYFQDVVALELFVDMLEHPARYQWVRVEADQAGYLDDVVAFTNDDKIVALQVKFSAHPESESDPWTWIKLLEKRNGKSPSLLQKWVSSIEQLQHQGSIQDARLVSNRKAAEEILSTLSTEHRVDFNKIPSGQIRKQIVQQLGDESRARGFFEQFRFDVDRPGLETYEEGLRKRFYRLGGPSEGWLNLKNELRFWIRNRNQPPPNGAITVATIRIAALWYELQSLPQRFQVPSDYVLPSQVFHDSLVSDLLILKKGCIILTGSPGLGKSTYLSYLFEVLTKKGIPTVRHHYFLSMPDRSVGRLDHHRIATSLMNDIRSSFPEALGNVGNRNPTPDEFSQWINACGSYFSSKGAALIVIIDGLDHVLREQGSSKELADLFGLLLPSPDGIVILLGTQPIDDAQLPLALVRAVSGRKELPQLDLDGVGCWLRHHEAELSLPGDPNARKTALDRLSEAFWKKSEGQPLHLRYTLKALQEQDLIVTPESIGKLPGCPHQDITLYYEELWHGLPEGAKEILHLLSACRFSWPSKGIVECLDPQAHNLPQVNEHIKRVTHLLVHDTLGLRAFHSSLLVFVQTRSDHSQYSSRMRVLALDWLRTVAPAYWKWAYAWLLESELGNSQPLMSGPTRQWVIESLSKGYPRLGVSEILARSAYAALESEDLARCVEVGLLRDYSEAAFMSSSDVLDNMRYPQLVVEDDPVAMAYFDISTAGAKALVFLAEAEASHGNQLRVHVCLDELNDRLEGKRGKLREQTLDSGRQLVDSLLRVAALDNQIVADKILAFAISNKERGYSEKILSTYAEALRISDKVAPIRDLLKTQMMSSERSVVLRHAVFLAFENGVDFAKEVTESESRWDPFAAIYSALNKLDGFDPGRMEFGHTELLELREYEQWEKRTQVEQFYYVTFYRFLANALWKHADCSEEWLDQEGDGSWPHIFLKELSRIASELAQLLLSGSPPQFGWIYKELEGLKRPEWPDDRDVYDYGQRAESAINEIALDIVTIGKALGRTPEISSEDLKVAFDSGYFTPHSWMEVYIAHRRTWLGEEAVKWLVDQEIRTLGSSISPFVERATEYCTLASILAMHNLSTEAKTCLREAASNLLSYGYHKDMLLYGALEVVQACHKAGLADARQWLTQLAPAIANVNEFTDGDETDHLPRELADVLAETASDILPSYYQWLCRKEEYYDALYAFHVLLRNVDLSVPTNQALAKTAVDEEGLEILAERAEKGEKNAKKLLLSLPVMPGHTESTKSSEAPSDLLEGAAKLRYPNPADFPPDRLPDYLLAAKGKHEFIIFLDETIAHWLKFWKDTDRAEDALRAIEREEARGTKTDNYDTLFDLFRSFYGKQPAYPWLVKAHIDRHGWDRYWVQRAEAVRRWNIVKDDYPDQWFRFIQDTMKSVTGEPWSNFTVREKFIKLVEYCLFMDKKELAKETSVRVIDTTIALVSSLNVGTPEWTKC